MSPSEYLGIFAGIFTTFAVVPQIIRVYKLKSAREISLIFTTSMLFGVMLWLVYGILMGLVALIVWNSIGVVLNGWLLLAKATYSRGKNVV